MQSMVHTTTQATLMQLLFGRDAIMNLTFDANWHLIEQCKQNLINQSNSKENSKQVKHTYKINDSVLVKNEYSTKYGKYAYKGPWIIQEVRDNETIKISKGPVSNNNNNIKKFILHWSACF